MQQSHNNTEFEETEEVSISDLLYKFLPYWPIFVLLLILALAGAWLYLRYTVPVYQTTATLLIKDDKNTPPNANDMMQAFDMFGSKKNVENEVEVLQSKTLMQQVVKDLHLYAPINIKGRVLNQSAYIYSPIIIEARDPDSIKIVKKVPFKYNSASATVNIEQINYPVNQWLSTPYGILKFLPNKYYKPSDDIKTEKENDFYFSLTTVKKAVNSVLNDIIVAPSSKQSTVIDLSIKGTIPNRGEDILNDLLKAYTHASILDKNMLAANTLKFVNDRLKFVESDLDSVEGSLQRFKSKNKITDISAQGQIYLQTVAANDQKISDINMQLAVLDQVENYVKSKGGLGGVVPATLGVADPVLIDLLQKLSELELQNTQMKKIVPENNPAVVALVDGINKLKPGILENINSQRKNLVAGRNDLSGTNNRYSSMLITIPEKERELLGISRQQAIKNNIYTFLLQKREETALSFASAVADSRVIDQAESGDAPVSPRPKLIYLAALFAAFVLGIAIIYLKDVFTRTIQVRSDIEKYTDIPVLGEVVYDRSRNPIVITEGKRSFIAEQFRQLRTSLAYMGVDEVHKKIMITSSISGEGKSFIAVNLGMSLSLMAKKVILIELDLRKPKLSEQFNISRHIGLSNYLIGKATIEEIIKPTGSQNLSLIPSGAIPPNPSELISNGRLLDLMEYLDGHFDYILIDTAPVNPVTDAFIISPLCDVSLYVVRESYTYKMFLKKLAEKFQRKSLKNPAIVFNGIRGKGFGRYGYGYGYGAGYGYGYTEDDENGGWWKRIFKK
ncbi:MAG: polysaccharide biosynthesis tyrosine autokinase [Ginsengibacter sp.]